MRFNLEPGDTACDGRSKLVAVKINNEERINLPFTSYAFDKDHFIIPPHSGTIHLRSFVNTLIKRYCSKYVMGYHNANYISNELSLHNINNIVFPATKTSKREKSFSWDGLVYQVLCLNFPI